MSREFTAEEMRDMAFKVQPAPNMPDSEYKRRSKVEAMLRQAADAEEELARVRLEALDTLKKYSACINELTQAHTKRDSLKARLDAVVKECERVRHIGETRIGEKVLTYVPRNHEIADAILSAARGEGGAE